MLKQFIIGVFSSAVAHRIFPPPRTDGKSRGGSCILRLISLFIVIGLLFWALGYGIVTGTTGGPLSLYAGLKFLATNVFIALDKLFYPGFDAPPAAVWGVWGLIGGAAIQGFRELRRNGRKGQGLLVALAPLLLMFLTGSVKSLSVPENPMQIMSQKETEPVKRSSTTIDKRQESTQKTTTETKTETITTPRQKVPETEPTHTTPRPPVRTTKQQNDATPLPVEPTDSNRIIPEQKTVPSPAVVTKSSLPNPPVNMVLIPAGEFQMGSSESDDEKPVHPVYIDAFYMDKYEVTNAQYKIFIQANPQWQKGSISSKYHDGDYLKNWNGNNYPSGKATHPVTFVSWYGAMAYAKWVGKRLPTEAEWEKAARGGLVGKKHQWGDYITSAVANYNKTVDDTTDVGKYPDNGYSLYDMTGNVSEWCIDMYNKTFYGNSPPRNPVAGTNLSSIAENFTKVNTQRVLRGGSWNSALEYTRVAKRTKADPKLSHETAGFRCVQLAVPTTTTPTITVTEKKNATDRAPVRTTTDTPKAVPKAYIQKVWVDHNQYQDSVKGMLIHVKFNIHNFKDNKGRVVAYFYTKNGDPLKDTNGSYKTTSGNISASRNFQPDYLKAIYNDYRFFMPYKELHMARGKHNLKFCIRIFKTNPWASLSDKSDWFHFTYSR